MDHGRFFPFGAAAEVVGKESSKVYFAEKRAWSTARLQWQSSGMVRWCNPLIFIYIIFFSHYNHLYKSTAITMIDKHAQITLQMPLLKLANVSVKSQKAQPFLQKRAGQGGGLQPAAFVCSHRAHFGRFLKASRLAWRWTSRRPWGQGWEARGKTSISCETSSNFHIV